MTRETPGRFLVPSVLAALLLGTSAHAAAPATELQNLANAHYEKHYRAILEEYTAFLAISNHASNREDDIEKNLPVFMPLPSLLLSLPRTRGMRCSAEPASASTRSRARRLDT